MKTERLIRLTKILRRARRPVTASTLAEKLEVTERTIYRDVATLNATGTAIRGEAGIGYVLEEGYELPPLMFTMDELEALMLGARMVESRADDDTAEKAQDAIAKIAAAVPKAKRAYFLESPLYAPNFRPRAADLIDIRELKRALREQRVLRIAYRTPDGRRSERDVWPLSLGFFESTRALVAWCELRVDFRHFRADRIEAMEVLERRYPEPRRTVLARWWETQDFLNAQTS